MEKIALVVGSTGIAGSNLAKELLVQGWTTYGLSRTAKLNPVGVRPIQADLLDVDQLKQALQGVKPTHIFFSTWMQGASEEANIQINSALVRNLLDSLADQKSIQHVALVTGLKHYLGPFESYMQQGAMLETPVREEQPRLAFPNFYYAQEDVLYAAALRDGFTWSVHRPHTVIGKALGNLMNMGTTLAVYAAICKEAGLPFIFPGSEAQWNGLSDLTAADVLAKQLIWAADTPEAANNCYNVVNGDLFRWRKLWQELADWFGIAYEGYKDCARPLTAILAGKEGLWQAMAAKYNLQESDLHRVSSAWHTDLDLGRPMEVMTDMYNSRTRGFTAYAATKDSFLQLFEELRADKIIP